jgi:hypothetical protein
VVQCLDEATSVSQQYTNVKTNKNPIVLYNTK